MTHAGEFGPETGNPGRTAVFGTRVETERRTGASVRTDDGGPADRSVSRRRIFAPRYAGSTRLVSILRTRGSGMPEPGGFRAVWRALVVDLVCFPLSGSSVGQWSGWFVRMVARCHR